MDLVNGAHGRRGLERFERSLARAFARPVIHHGDSRGDAADEHRVVAHVEAVVVHLVEIHGADDVGRTDELLLHVPSEIAAVEKSERAKLKHQHDAVRIVGLVLRFRRNGAAERVRGHRPGRRSDEFLIRAEAAERDCRAAGRLLQRDRFTCGDGHALLHFCVAIRLAEDGPELVRAARVRVVRGDAFVIQRADGHERREVREPAEMIHMEVRDDDMIDPLQPRDLRGDLVDARRIAFAGIAGVHEHGFALRRDDERRAAALGINPVDVEGAAAFLRATGG